MSGKNPDPATVITVFGGGWESMSGIFDEWIGAESSERPPML